MKLNPALLVVALWLPLIGTSAAQEPIRTQTLCGWYQNPSPANFYLTDRMGQWTIGTQGGHQAEGDMPEFKASQWVEYVPNGGKGYGCACITGSVNTQTHEVLRIDTARVRPISVCRKDKALPPMVYPPKE